MNAFGGKRFIRLTNLNYAMVSILKKKSSKADQLPRGQRKFIDLNTINLPDYTGISMSLPCFRASILRSWENDIPSLRCLIF